MDLIQFLQAILVLSTIGFVYALYYINRRDSHHNSATD